MQLIISVSQTGVMFLQGWVSLHMNTIINIRLISDYLRRLASLPLQFFEIRSMGDILQRIGDHDRIKNFLMNDMISILFSLGTFITFFCVLAVFNWKILLVFMIGNIIHITWILSFLKYRRGNRQQNVPTICRPAKQHGAVYSRNARNQIEQY